MPKRKPFSELIASWTPEERIERAKIVIKRLTHELGDALQRHENNEYVQFKDEFISKIPRSRGVWAFVVLQRDLASYEVIRLLALWDRAADNALSIPTAIELIDNEAVIQNPSSHTVSLAGLSFLMCCKSESWFMSRIKFFCSCDPLAQMNGIEISFPQDLLDCNLPATVQPRAAHTAFVPCAVIERLIAGSNEAVFQVVVRDALGRKRYSPKLTIPALIDEGDVQVAIA